MVGYDDCIMLYPFLVDVRERKHQHVWDFVDVAIRRSAAEFREWMSPSNMYWVPSGYVKIAIEHGHRNNEFSH